MAYDQSDYTFTRKYNANGSKTRWYSVLSFLAEHGPCSKDEILKNIYNATPILGDSIYIIGHGAMIKRGYCSHMFGCMHDAGIINYDKHTKLWSIGKTGDAILHGDSGFYEQRSALIDSKARKQILNSKKLQQTADDFEKTIEEYISDNRTIEQRKAHEDGLRELIELDGNTQRIVPLYSKPVTKPSLAKNKPTADAILEGFLPLFEHEVDYLIDDDKCVLTIEDKNALIGLYNMLETLYVQYKN